MISGKAAASMPADVTIRWRFLQPDDDGLTWSRCLYALISRNKKEILYIGKTSRSTVAHRLRCRSKSGMWDQLAEQGIGSCIAQVGDITLERGGRFSEALLSDIETLLIMAEQPTGNVQGRTSRIARHGLSVACTGSWRGRARVYLDGG